MKLTISDRLNIPSLYPEKSSIIEQTIVRDIAEKVKVTQEEMTAIDLKTIDTKDKNGQTKQSLQWNPEKAKEKEIVFTEAESKLLLEKIEELDKKKEITRNLLELCLKLKSDKVDSKKEN